MGQMADGESGGDPIAILEEASAKIGTARQTLQQLYQQLAMMNGNAKEIARNELCRGLVERLQSAEREAAELADLIVMARKP
jgi:flagellar biosynthesis chaperone FliJ